MSDPEPPTLEALELAAETKRPWWRRRWATIGEVVGVCALMIAGLGYWDAHRERGQEAARRTAEARREQARTALVLTGEAQADGSRITLSTLGAGQAVQSQRYLFPKPVLGHPMEVTAARPQIALAWFDGGLKVAVGGSTGEGVLPVGVVTRYIEDGEPREDRSLYAAGYAVRKAGLFGGRKATLLGLSLQKRGVSGDLQAAVEAAWKAERARGLAAEAGG